MVRINLRVAPLAVAVEDISPPECLKCGAQSRRRITRPSNRKGNAGRPYYIRCRCDNFCCFADLRGCHPSNPHCANCDCPSRMQVAGRVRNPPGGLHYVCQRPTCDFHSPRINENEK
ncbi:hypothetical protein CGRA01v4_10552 [Colletotrichum graminicola]|nr:hypothetical protein CGRA01v4_10552 [Colletotrichum graminicola]